MTDELKHKLGFSEGVLKAIPSSYVISDQAGFLSGTNDTMQQNRHLEDSGSELLPASGKVLRVKANASPMHDLEGKLIGSMVILTDITDLYEQQQMIMEQHERISMAAKEADVIAHSLAAPGPEILRRP